MKFITVQKHYDEDISFSVGIGWITEYVRKDEDATVYESRLAVGGTIGVYSIEVVFFRILKRIPRKSKVV